MNDEGKREDNQGNSTGSENGKIDGKNEIAKSSHNEGTSELEKNHENGGNSQVDEIILLSDNGPRASNENVKLSIDSEGDEVTRAQIKLSKDSGKLSLHRWYKSGESPPARSYGQDENHRLSEDNGSATIPNSSFRESTSPPLKKGPNSEKERTSPEGHVSWAEENQMSSVEKRPTSEEKRLPLDEKWSTPEEKRTSLNEQWSAPEEKRNTLDVAHSSFNDDQFTSGKKLSTLEENLEAHPSGGELLVVAAHVVSAENGKSPDEESPASSEIVSHSGGLSRHTREKTSTSEDIRESPVENRLSSEENPENVVNYNMEIPQVVPKKERLAASFDTRQVKKTEDEIEDEDDYDETVVPSSQFIPAFPYADSLAQFQKPKSDHSSRESLLDDWPHTGPGKYYHHPKGPKIHQDHSEYIRSKLNYWARSNSSPPESKKRYSELAHPHPPRPSPDYENMVEARGPTARARRLEEAREDADVLGKHMQERAAKVMLDLLEIYKPLKTTAAIKDKSAVGKLPSASNAASLLNKLEREIKITERRVAESKREQAYTLYQINELEMKLLRNEEERLIRSMMNKIPNSQDLDRIQSLKNIMLERRQVENNIRRLKIELAAINKVISDVDVILSETGVVKKRRRVVIQAGSARELDTTSKLIVPDPIDKETEEKKKTMEAQSLEIDSSSQPLNYSGQEINRTSLEQTEKEERPSTKEPNNFNETNQS